MLSSDRARGTLVIAYYDSDKNDLYITMYNPMVVSTVTN